MGIKRKVLVLIVLLMSAKCYAGDFVCYDEEGIITSKHYSVNGDKQRKQGCLRVERKMFKVLTRWYKIINNKVIKMTQEEKDAILAAEAAAVKQAAIIAVNNLEITVIDLGKALVQLDVVGGADLKAKIKEIKGLDE